MCHSAHCQGPEIPDTVGNKVPANVPEEELGNDYRSPTPQVPWTPFRIVHKDAAQANTQPLATCNPYCLCIC